MSHTAITNVRVFDGNEVHQATTVVISGTTITSLGGEIPDGALTVDGEGCTLLPGLFDSHVHTAIPQLELALKFGVTTELEMAGQWHPDRKKEVSERDDLADIRSANYGLTPVDGHPHQLTKSMNLPAPQPNDTGLNDNDTLVLHPQTKEEAVQFVKQRVKEGADYIKIMIEEGSILNHPGLPVSSEEIMSTAVQEAHNNEKIAIAHAMTYEATETAIRIGIDGLAHLFLDRGADSSIIDRLKGKFITPCLSLNSSILGIKPSQFAADPRVSARLPQVWLTHLNGSMDLAKGDFNLVLKSVADLHKAGVDILCGTDSSFPAPHLAGLAHGASVHHELQLLVQAGLTPVEALCAATSVPARIFGLKDRGRIQKGLRADLLLVEGDPTTNIADTLSIKSVWRRGSLLSYGS